MDRNKLIKWFKEPAKMGHKYSLHAIYFCTGCGIIEVPPSITARWDSQAGKLIFNYRLCFSENLESDNKDL
jgi:NADH:ubiquinone oxidoreductase subunit B-like Fe-S oxidoreductase